MEISLSKLFSVFLKKWYIILAVALLFAIIVYAGSALLHDDTYTATATVLLNASNPGDSETLNSSTTTALQNMISTYIQFFEEEVIIDSAREAYPQEFEKFYVQSYLAAHPTETEIQAAAAFATEYPNGVTLPYTNREIQSATQINQKDDSLIFLIRVTLPNRVEAITVANTLAEQSEQIKSYLPSCEGRIITSAKVASLNGTSSLKYSVVAFAIGGILSAFVLAVIYTINMTVRTKKELKEITNLPIVGTVPFVTKQARLEPDITTNRMLLTQEREAYYSIRANLLYLLQDSQNKSILFTSTLASEDKCTTLGNTAIAFAKAGKKVCVLDADFYHSTMQELFTIKSKNGLSDIIVGKKALDACVHATSIPNIDIILSGKVPANPSEMLMDEKMDDLIQTLESKYDYVLINTPPVYMINDASILAPRTAGMVFVMRANVTKRSIFTDAIESLQAIGTNVLGVIWKESKPQRLLHAEINNFEAYEKYYETEGLVNFFVSEE